MAKSKVEMNKYSFKTLLGSEEILIEVEAKDVVSALRKWEEEAKSKAPQQKEIKLIANINFLIRIER